MMLIGGQWIKEGMGGAIRVQDPATEEFFAEVPKASEKEVDLACKAAAEAFKVWSRSLPSERAIILSNAALELERKTEEIAELITREQGKPLREAKGEVQAAVKALRFFASRADLPVGEWRAPNHPRIVNLVKRYPVGPVAVISPWNYPVLLTAWKVAPALAAGCTVVIKPSSKTPLAVTEFVKCLVEAGIPEGVVNLVHGGGQDVGVILVNHPDIRKITFTGKTETGKMLMRLASAGLKRLTLEFGGHCPLIVAADADLEAAVKGGVYRAFRNMGQVCNSINRIYVERSVYDQFVQLFVEHTKKLTIGPGFTDPDLGPMIDNEARQRVVHHIEDAVAKGAEIVYGGKIPARFEKGFFFEPTVLVNVSHEMVVLQEETFGPVAPIMAVESWEDAIRFANNSRYGLVAYLYTRDLGKALRAAELLEHGTVGINNVVGGEVEYPYAGWKESGFGFELSEHALNEFLLIKHIRLQWE
ncbi:MAG: aldehyde dehydrogenase family protein [Anaerolineales bacterium]